MGWTSSTPCHIWSRCHGCDTAPIVGQKFECLTCPDGPDCDLCERCYSLYRSGRLKHPPPGSFAAAVSSSEQREHHFRSVAGRTADDAVAWLTVPSPGAEPPTVPNGFVLRPEFLSGQESFIGSYGFVVKDSSLLLLTALHVMGHLSQTKGIDCSLRNGRYSGGELPAIVSGVNLYDVFAPVWMTAYVGTADSMLILPEARIREPEPYSQRDIAAFLVPANAHLAPLGLASRLPKAGEPVWLAAPHRGSPSMRTREAVVVEASASTLIFRYAGSQEIPPSASGAPLLNQAGEVVGINIGAGTFENHKFGHGNHVASVRGHLASAGRAAP